MICKLLHYLHFTQRPTFFGNGITHSTLFVRQMLLFKTQGEPINGTDGS